MQRSRIGGLFLAGLLAACGSTSERDPDSCSGASCFDAGTQPSTETEQAIARVNQWRRQAGFASIAANARLQKAAQNHAKFAAANPRNCWPGSHDEVGSCAGFTGASPGDRLTAVGYSWGTYLEAMNGGEGTPESAVDGWLWTVYHRLVLFWPDITEGGFDCESDICVLDVARPSGTSAPTISEPLVFPSPDMTGVPVHFDGTTEAPMPPTPSKGWPSGPVISIHFPAAWDISTATLVQTDASSQLIPIKLVTPATDSNLSNFSDEHAFLYAESPLAVNTSYTVHVEGTVNNAPWSKTWSFTTTGP